MGSLVILVFMILKVMKNYNIPAHGILFDDRGARPGSYSGKVFDV